jgi:glyoxylase-like metal-dependent hydrolase (beta-lactamase superfamily II)
MPRHGDLVVRGFVGGGFAENCFLVGCTRTGSGILVDPGAAVKDALAAATDANIELEAIVLTHSHLDHVDGVAHAKRETGAPVLLHQDARPMYDAILMQAQMFGVSVEPLPAVDGDLVPGQSITVGDCELEIRFAPGHAPGHVILVGDGAAIVGDCVFAGSIGRTDLPGGDLQTLMHSIRTQILTLPDETTLYSGHGPETTVGHERATNPFLVPHMGGSSFA